MAIALEFFDLVIPVARIRESYPGGWEQCLTDFAGRVGQRVWYDQHLFRDGAMSLDDMRELVEGWTVLGFEAIGKRPPGHPAAKRPYWKDVCVVDWARGGPTHPCDWLQVDLAGRTAHLAGTDPGPLAWRGLPRIGQAG